MEFLDISSLGMTYRYTAKLSKNSNRKSETLDLGIRSKGKVPPNRRTKDIAKAWKLKKTCQSCKTKSNTAKPKKEAGK